jgi:tryptophanyl-tRNA synthetase
MEKQIKKELVFSGIQPTSRPHLGNYLGMLKSAVELQKSHECIYSIVDLHAVTKYQKPSELWANTRDIVLDLLALGIDPDKSIFFVQSQVSQHAELAWLLNTITPLSWLDRLGPYKEQIAEDAKLNQIGILDYPVLMAADILLYKANVVPVGEDQLPHIDVANEIAKRFNHLFGFTFEPIKPLLAKGARIMSLDDPKKKMSKSGDSGISLADTPDQMRKKIKRAVTDSGSEIRFTPGAKPAISNLMLIFSELAGKDLKSIEAAYKGKGYADFKKDLAEVVVEHFSEFKKRRTELEKDPAYADKVLKVGSERAAEIARTTLCEIRRKMGFI